MQELNRKQKVNEKVLYRFSVFIFYHAYGE